MLIGCGVIFLVELTKALEMPQKQATTAKAHGNLLKGNILGSDYLYCRPVNDLPWNQNEGYTSGFSDFRHPIVDAFRDMKNLAGQHYARHDDVFMSRYSGMTSVKTTADLGYSAGSRSRERVRLTFGATDATGSGILPGRIMTTALYYGSNCEEQIQLLILP